MRTLALCFDDCPKNHLTYVAPQLAARGFGATFFATRFTEEWRREHLDTLLTAQELRALHDQGFEIGNHGWNHAGGDIDAETLTREIDTLDAWLADAGIPRPIVYAYPGGPFQPQSVALLKARGYLGARAVGTPAWRPAEDDPFRLPAWSLCGDFSAATEEIFATGGDPASLPIALFHGVPEIVHPWVHTEPKDFEAFLNRLVAENWRVISLGQALRETVGARA